MSRKNIYEMNYAKLAAILGQAPEKIEPSKSYTLRSEGFMDFIVEKVSPCETTGATLLSLSHYYEANGDPCQDPEVLVRVYPPGEDFREYAPSSNIRLGRIEVIYFQQAIPPRFDEVYPETGKYSPGLKGSLNALLALWLRNLKNQGHTLIDEDQDNGAG